jgi:sortase A
MSKLIPSTRKIQFLKIVSLVSFILGIAFTLWALFQIIDSRNQVSEQRMVAQQQGNGSYLEPGNESNSKPRNEFNEINELNDLNDLNQKILYPVRPEQGENIGALSIPKINQSLPILHGTDEDELEKGVGHYAKSVLPGELDNSVLSGHRDTVFRRLGELEKGDLLIVETRAGVFTYQIYSIRIVDQNDTSVIVPSDRAILTLSTCYPFNFIGDAPERYILVSNLVDSQLK